MDTLVLVGGACMFRTPINKGGCASLLRSEVLRRWELFVDLSLRAADVSALRGIGGAGRGSRARWSEQDRAGRWRVVCSRVPEGAAGGVAQRCVALRTAPVRAGPGGGGGDQADAWPGRRPRCGKDGAGRTVRAGRGL